MFSVATLSAFAALSFLSSTNAAIGPKGNFKIANQIVTPDGFNRSAVVPGGSFPGPLIQANKGDKFQLNVINALTDSTMEESTSIHWHGLFQKGTNWADGPSFVTQCPIIPGNSFEYDFSVPDQAGTFWYHSHISTQYCDGLRGPLVVYDSNDPHKNLYDVDDESTVITLSDWYHLPSPAIVGAPISDSTLINGKGRYVNGPAAPLAVVNVQHGKRYRFRLVAMSCDANFVFSIDGHQMTIIEADGENTQPLVVDSIQIFTGQRYSFVLNANQPVNNYWIRANPDPFSAVPGFDGGRNSAILRYSGAPATDPTTNQTTSVNPLVETNLHALTNPRAPGKPEVGGADKVINLAVDFDLSTLLFTVNNATFVPPTVPVLLQILSGAHDAQDLLPAGSVYTLQPNIVVELTIPGGAAGGPHPIHLHGHSFSVVRSAGSSSYNWDNPVRRDVVSIGNSTDDLVTIRFETDNAGPWFLHCHIDFHLALGFAVVFAENPNNTKALNPVPQSWSNLCPAYNNYNTSHPEKFISGANTNNRLPRDS